jgi:hypothetical protein
MSLTPSFAQAAILAKPLLSAVFATQAQGVTVFADPDPDQFDVFVTGGVLESRVRQIATGIANARGDKTSREEKKEIEAQLRLIKTTEKAYLVVSDVSKKDALAIKVELVGRGSIVTPTSAIRPLKIKIIFFGGGGNASKKGEITQIKCWVELSSLVNIFYKCIEFSTYLFTIKWGTHYNKACDPVICISRVICPCFGIVHRNFGYCFSIIKISQ